MEYILFLIFGDVCLLNSNYGVNPGFSCFIYFLMELIEKICPVFEMMNLINISRKSTS